MKNNKQLTRSKKNKVLFGIIGGLAEYFEIDAVLSRIICILAFIFTGFFPLGIIYIIAIFVIPEGVDNDSEKVVVKDVQVEKVNTEEVKDSVQS